MRQWLVGTLIFSTPHSDLFKGGNFQQFTSIIRYKYTVYNKILTIFSAATGPLKANPPALTQISGIYNPKLKLDITQKVLTLW